VGGVLSSVLLPEQHASIVHGRVDKQVTIWTPGREQQWRTRKASAAAELLAAEAGAEDVFLSVNQFHGRRLVRNLAALTALFVDVDAHDAPTDLVALMDSRLDIIARARLPAPSFVVFSGRGLHFYWVIEPLPAAVLARWQPCQRHLQRLLGGDPAAVDCTRLLRVVGTVNSRAPAHCRTVTGILNSVSCFNFDWLAEQILPRSRAEIRDIAVQRAKTQPLTKTAGATGKRTIYEWWMAVYRDLYILINHHWPAGVAEGHRNNLVFLLAVALSWFTSSDALEAEVVGVARRVAPTLTETEVLSYTSSLRQRAARAALGERIEWQGKLRDPRYYFRRETLYQLLKALITPALEAKLTAVMSTEERDRRRNVRERARDRVADGRYRSSHADPEARARAISLSLDGHSARVIATMISVPRSTVADWIRSANTKQRPAGFARLT